MNKYHKFFLNLKLFLIENDFHTNNDFQDLTPEQKCFLDKRNTPLAYKEWLYIFGNTEQLLGFNIEDYSFEELVYCSEDSFLDKNEQLFPITNMGDLYVYLHASQENPTVYHSVTDFRLEKRLDTKSKFTTYIKELIIGLINNSELNNKKQKNYFKDFNTENQKSIYKDFLKEIDRIETEKDEIVPIIEHIYIWNVFSSFRADKSWFQKLKNFFR